MSKTATISGDELRDLVADAVAVAMRSNSLCPLPPRDAKGKRRLLFTTARAREYLDRSPRAFRALLADRSSLAGLELRAGQSKVGRHDRFAWVSVWRAHLLLGGSARSAARRTPAKAVPTSPLPHLHGPSRANTDESQES